MKGEGLNKGIMSTMFRSQTEKKVTEKLLKRTRSRVSLKCGAGQQGSSVDPCLEGNSPRPSACGQCKQHTHGGGGNMFPCFKWAVEVVKA